MPTAQRRQGTPRPAQIALAAVFVFLWGSLPASAQDHFPLEILSPLPVGAGALVGKDADHRIYWAYPNLEYRIRVAAIGGEYPYTFSLSGEPAGMSIVTCAGAIVNADLPTCGVITWTPTDENQDDASITVEVCDQDNDCVSRTWGIDVTTSTARFRFVDAVGGSTSGVGTLADPAQTLEDVHEDGWGGSPCVYFRAGTYTTNGISIDSGAGTVDQRIGFDQTGSTNRPTCWLAYPGETPVLDFGYAGSGFVSLIRIGGENVYVDGWEFMRWHSEAFNPIGRNSYGFTFINNDFHDGGPGTNGANSAALMYTNSAGANAFGSIVQNNTFADILYGTGNCALKVYNSTKDLIEDNIFSGLTGVNAFSEDVVALKNSATQFTVRANTFHSNDTAACCGNMNDDPNPTYGEFLYNDVRPTTFGYAMRIDDFGQIQDSYFYRNTFQADVLIQDGTFGGDGLKVFTRNVIVNDGGSGGSCPQRISCEAIPNFSVIQLSNNLQGLDDGSIVNAGTGVLEEPSLTDDGPESPLPKGHLIGGAPEADVENPVVTITTPTSSATYDTGTTPLTVAGSCTDNAGVQSVSWVNAAGGSGLATGTGSWSANIALTIGSNAITVTCVDTSENEGTDLITVTYTSPGTLPGTGLPPAIPRRLHANPGA